MNKRKIVMIIAGVLFIGCVAFNFVGCGGGGGGGSSSGSSSAGNVTLSGALDGQTVVGLPPYENSFFKHFCLLFSPKNLYANGGADVNKIVAISSRGNNYTLTEAILNGNNFSLSVSKDKPYLLVFLNNTTIIGVYKVDDATDLDAFPLNSASSNIDMGTVSLSGTDVISGTISQAAIFNSLGITESLASVIGIMDDEMLRLAGSLDVDQNGSLDILEDKWYPFIIHFEFDPGSFTDMVNTFSAKVPIIYTGYGFYMHMNPCDTTIDWQTGGTLTSPAPINGVTDKASGPAWVSGNQASLDFHSGGSPGTSPVIPPEGTYTVTMPIIGTGGTKTYIYNNVKSYGIDSNLYYVYIPTLRLNIDGSNKITSIDIQWWKKLPGTGWVQPDATELNMLLHDATIEISPVPPSGPTDPKVSVSMAGFSNPTNLIPPSQGFTTGYIRMIYTDKFGYVYGFSWN